jgi:hypothetical protein
LTETSITTQKVKFPKKIKRKRRPRPKKEQYIPDYSITARRLESAGIEEGKDYTIAELVERLRQKTKTVRDFTETVPKKLIVKEYNEMKGNGPIIVRRNIAHYSGEAMFKFARAREAGEIPKAPKRDFNDDSIKLPATLCMRRRRKKSRKKRVVRKCEFCGSIVNSKKPLHKRQSYSEMLRESGKFQGTLSVRAIRKQILQGKRFYVRTKET